MNRTLPRNIRRGERVALRTLVQQHPPPGCGGAEPQLEALVVALVEQRQEAARATEHRHLQRLVHLRSHCHTFVENLENIPICFHPC